jgi:putative tricarboxylic transport membrane protein
LKRGWQIATVCLLAFASFSFVVAVFGISWLNSRPLPLQDKLGPGPGFFPMWLSIIALGLGALLFIEVARQPADDQRPYPAPSRNTAVKALGTLLVMAIAGWKFPTFTLLESLGIGSEAIRATLSAVLIAGAALALTIWPNQQSEMSDDAGALRIAAVIGLLMLAAALLDSMGFRFTAAVFTGLLLIALGAPSPKFLIPFVLFASLGVFYVFYHALKVPLPIGPYDWILKPLETAAIALWAAVSGFFSFFSR